MTTHRQTCPTCHTPQVDGEPIEHPYFNFNDELVTFLVEGKLFTVHKYFFIRDSDIFRDLFSLPPPPGQDVEGRMKENPVRLDGVSSYDFEEFLKVLYPSKVGHEDLSSSEEWIAALSFADKYNFVDVRDLALKRLENIASPIDKIVLGHKHNKRDYLISGYTAVCTQTQSLQPHEIRRLDSEDIALIMAKREEALNSRYYYESYSGRYVVNSSYYGTTTSAIETHFQSRLPS